MDLRETLSRSERAVWDRIPHSTLLPHHLEIFALACRHIASAERLTQSMREWSDMDPVSELSALRSMRAEEQKRAAFLFQAIDDELAESQLAAQ